MSDLHFGARNGLDDPALEQGIADLVERLQPDLVVASGDLTHRGLRDEHEAAARYLHGLGRPLLVVPGNHDIPTFPPSRFTRTWQEFKRQWETTSPAHSSPTLELAGVNSVRAFGYQRGRVRAADLERAEAQLRLAPPGALRVVALHHQLAGAPWRMRKLPLAGRGRVLERLAAAGAELILSGHVHQATVATRLDFEIPDGVAATCVLATAPGLGRPRPSRRHEARGLLVHRADAAEISVEAHMWLDGSWLLTGTRTFPRLP